jgi:hypothetical protein
MSEKHEDIPRRLLLNRLTDDQNQPRIREEAGAVERILKLVRDGIVQWISSDALADEID